MRRRFWAAWDDIAFGFVLAALLIGFGIMLGILIASGQ